MGRWVKFLLAVVAYRTGLVGAWYRRRRRPVILMYHRVLEPAERWDVSQRAIIVTRPTFAKQLEALKKHFEVVPLEKAIAAQEGEVDSGQRPPCAITFDDGWADNHRCALPELQKAGVPATVFIATGYIDRAELFWPEQLGYVLSGPTRRRLTPEALDGVSAGLVARVMAVAEASDRRWQSAVDTLVERAKEMDEKERRRLIQILTEVTGRDPGGLATRMLTWRQVQELTQAGVELGSHTVSHPILTRVAKSRAEHELTESRRQLAEHLGTPPASFAYPNGDWNPELTQVVAAAGYARAVATEAPDPELNRRFHPYAAPRKNVSEDTSGGPWGYSESVFCCEVFGVFDRLRQLASPA